VFDLRELWDSIRSTIQTALVVILLAALLVTGSAAMVYRYQRNSARAEVQRMVDEQKAQQLRVESALREADRTRKEFKTYREWIQDHPAPRDPEALRLWIQEAVRR
jgi:predicted lipase